MSFLRVLSLVIILLSLATGVAAYAYVPETYQTNQLYAGSFYKPSTPYQGWNYYAYYPNSGYPVLGGGRYYPPGYFGGSYPVYPAAYPSYGYGSYFPYAVPVHTTVDFYYKGSGFSIYCTAYYC